MAEETQQNAQEQRKSLSLLAHEHFGSAFVGEVKRPEPEAPPADAEPAEPAETPPESNGQADAVPEAAPETEQPETEAEAAPADEAGDASALETFGELVEHFELDPDWARQLKVSVKVNGSTSQVPLADAIQSYEIGQATKERLEEAKQHARTAREEWSQKSQQLDSQIASAGSLIGAAEKVLDQESAIDWNKLREDDPAEFSAKKAEIAERRQALDNLKRQAAETFTQNQQAKQQEHQNLLQERLQQEAQSLLEKMPEWQDADRAKREKTELSEYLTSQGFSPQEVANAVDHRAIVIARKAMLFDRQNATGTVARKKLAKVPKTLKPGTPKPQDQRDREQIAKAKSRLRQTGSLDDALAVIRAKRANNGRSSRNLPNQ